MGNCFGSRDINQEDFRIKMADRKNFQADYKELKHCLSRAAKIIEEFEPHFTHLSYGTERKITTTSLNQEHKLKEAKSKIESLSLENSDLQKQCTEYTKEIETLKKILQDEKTRTECQQLQIQNLQSEKESSWKSETLQLECKIKLLEDELAGLKKEDTIKRKICKHEKVEETKDIILRGALKEAGVSEAIVTCINKLFIKKLSGRMKRNHFDVHAQVCSEPPLEVIDPFLVIGLKRARAEHDVENSLRGLPVSKVTGFVYVHMIGDKTKIDEIIPTKLSRFDLPPIADLVFHNTDGILDCEINQMALDTIAKWLASKWA